MADASRIVRCCLRGAVPFDEFLRLERCPSEFVAVGTRRSVQLDAGNRRGVSFAICRMNEKSRRGSSALLSSGICPIQIGLTFSARGPFGPRPSVYDTFCPSRSAS